MTTNLIHINTLTTHYRNDNDNVLCCDCAQHSIWKITKQVGVKESPQGYDPLECVSCVNIILTVEEAAAKAARSRS